MRKREFTGKLPAIATEPGKCRAYRDANRYANRAERSRTKTLLSQARRDESVLEKLRLDGDPGMERWSPRDSNDIRWLGWWMEAHVGLPWDHVYSKLCHLAKKNSYVGCVLRGRIIWRVNTTLTQADPYPHFQVDEDGILRKWDDEVFEYVPYERH